MRKLFNWALPRFLQPAAEMPAEPEQQERRLAGVSDTDPVLRALTQELHEQFQEEVVALLDNRLGQVPGLVEYQRGRAAGMYALLLRIETQREAAKEEAKARSEREAKQRK